MQLTDKQIKEFQDIYEKKYGKKLSWEEAIDAANNLMGFAELLFKSYITDQGRKEKLGKYPKGFHIEGEGYSCCICHKTISNQETWYDKYGIKCLICQKAIEKRLIPVSVCKNKDSWYSMWEFDYYFGVKPSTVRKFVRQGKLKVRIVPGEKGKTYFEIFLIKDNPGVLPKKPESRLVETEDRMMRVEYEKIVFPLSEDQKNK
ncbi:hypothetical protein HQ544_01565 [Candidatus Falkowbacteria bacterium]|nr:hypothetical protein [Candidatus Falkowbacteria bacterium]